ncbi:MAG: DNA translocase FtsK 4TM domain-containing protein [Lentisphaeria bacterium]|nr:DNA translocase FtsK 4TM domain-containing protein [Lentisphaeria bacterium]
MKKKQTAKSRQKEAAENAAPASGFRVRYIFYFALAILLVLAIFSYNSGDMAVLDGGSDELPANWIGNCGARLAWIVFTFCGLGGYLLAVLISLAMLRALLPGRAGRLWMWLGGFCLMLGSLLLLALFPAPFAGWCEQLNLRDIPGGVIGQFFTAPKLPEKSLPDGVLLRLIGPVGSAVVGWAMVLAGGILFYLGGYRRFFGWVPGRVSDGWSRGRDRLADWAENFRESRQDDCCEDDEPPVQPVREPRRIDPVPEDDRGGDDDDDDTEGRPWREPAGRRSAGLRTKLAGLGAGLKNMMDRPGEPEHTVSPRHSRLAELVRQMEDCDDAEDGSDGFAPAYLRQEEPPPETAAPPPPEPEAAPADEPAATVLPSGTPKMSARVTVSGEKARPGREYTLPPCTMLGKGPDGVGEAAEVIEQVKRKLQGTLDVFGIAGHVVGHVSGPRITRYEITLDPGVMISRITRIEKDIKMALAAESLRMLAPIPGRNSVGIEIPNSRSEAIYMRAVMEGDCWRNTSMEIPIILGKNVAGRPILLDLAKAPHLLIAGATGSGKSVCMNTLIMSLLFRFGPDQLQLIMVDPKTVEMASYQTLPHLIAPVINDSSKVPIALRWAVNEMEHRYQLMALAGVKNLRGYNARRPDRSIRQLNGEPLPEQLPFLVIIIDELADLMASSETRSEVEVLISRITAKARAAGIHLVVATQRPDTKVITGNIKGNLPTRIAFKVVSGTDSRVILDRVGAENLLGRGDMLLLPPGASDIERIQGAMVDDADIEKVVEFVSAQAEQQFDSGVLDDTLAMAEEDEGEAGYSDRGEGYPDDGDEDFEPGAADSVIRKYLRPGDGERMYRALEIVINERKASTSYFQRRLGIGYNTAAELVDELERRGIISGPAAGGSKREILITEGL